MNSCSHFIQNASCNYLYVFLLFCFSRHVLKLEMSAPFGYLIDVYSLTTFKMSSEEEVWSELGKVNVNDFIDHPSGQRSVHVLHVITTLC